jgi:hypothetical protein
MASLMRFNHLVYHYLHVHYTTFGRRRGLHEEMNIRRGLLSLISFEILVTTYANGGIFPTECQTKTP